MNQGVLERRIALLQVASDRLSSLLNDPYPGVAAWVEAVPKAVREINEIMDGRRDEVTP